MNDTDWSNQPCRVLRAHPPRGQRRDTRDGRSCAVARGAVAAAWLAAFMVMMSFSTTARAQWSAGDIYEVPVHPETATIVQLPDEVTRTRVTPGAAMRVTLAGRTVHVRPDAGVPLGLQALLEVETASMLLTFRLRVIENFKEARQELVVVALKSEQRAEEGPLLGRGQPNDAGQDPDDAAQDPEDTADLKDAAHDPEDAAHDPADAAQTARMEMRSGSRGAGAGAALAPAPAEPAAGRDVVTERPGDVAVDDADTVVDTEPRKLDVSVHAVGGLPGFTTLHVPGYESGDARQMHLTFGVRAAGAPRGSWWAIEAGITGELPLTPTSHIKMASGGLVEVLEMSGPLLRMDLGLRAHFGTRWRPTVHAGFGLQAHVRSVDEFAPARPDAEPRYASPLTKTCRLVVCWYSAWGSRTGGETCCWSWISRCARACLRSIGPWVRSSPWVS